MSVLSWSISSSSGNDPLSRFSEFRMSEVKILCVGSIVCSAGGEPVRGQFKIPFRRQSHGLSTNSELLVSTELKISVPN